MSKDWCPVAKAVKHPDELSAGIALAEEQRKRRDVSQVYRCRRCQTWHVR